MKFDSNCKVLWKDRKRYCGLPWSFYRYYIVEKEGEWTKIFRHKGFFTSVIDETNVYRCIDVTLHISFFDRIFGTGTIEILSNDSSAPRVHFRHISNPYKVRDLLSSLIELERKKRGVGLTEFQLPN